MVCARGDSGNKNSRTASGIVLDIGAILKPRVEINWEKELKR